MKLKTSRAFGRRVVRERAVVVRGIPMRAYAARCHGSIVWTITGDAWRVKFEDALADAERSRWTAPDKLWGTILDGLPPA